MANLSLGAKNDTIVDILRKHLSPALVGRGWDAFLKALAVGDQYKADLGVAAFEQLFKSSASGVYLDRVMADDGVTRPPGIGIGDEAFRALGIKTTARKLLIEVILEVLETYYGSEATRAYVAASTAQPYALADEDDLYVEIDGSRTFRIVFDESGFTNINAATALEVATAITRSLRDLGSTAYAQAFQDPETGGSFVRIFSGALGLSGSVRILGGRAQNQLLFPSWVHITPNGPQAGTTWDLVPGNGTNGIDSGRIRFTFSAGTNPDLQDVYVDDIVNIYGSVFNVANRGAFPVKAVTTTYFEVENVTGVTQATVAQASVSDLIFFRPEKRAIQSTGRMATATQGTPGTLEVILPATTQIVQREENTGAYLHDSLLSVAVSSGARNASGTVTVNTTAAHGLQVGQWFFADNIKPAVGSVYTAVALGDPEFEYFGTGTKACAVLKDGRVIATGGDNIEGTLQSGVGMYTPSTGLWSFAASMLTGRSGHTATTLPDGRVLVVGGYASADSAEIYDPDTNSWAPATAPTGTYDFHSATLLQDGRVLVIGQTTTEIYNPATGAWLTVAAHDGFRYGNKSVLLADGRVLMVGGSQSIGMVYNPRNDTWTPTSACADLDLFAMALTAFGDGAILTGGMDDATVVTRCRYLNPATLEWEELADLPERRWYHETIVLSDGTLLIVGGLDPFNEPIPQCHVYDRHRHKWIKKAAWISTAHMYSFLVELESKNILVVGGIKVDGTEVFSDLLISPYSLTSVSSTSSSGGLNGLFQVASTPSPASFTFSTPEFKIPTTFTTGTISSVRARTNDIQGPFIYDPDNGVAVTGVETETTTTIEEGSSYNVLGVVNAEYFPDEEGWLCFGFGTSDQLQPVRYLGRISDENLLLDPTYTFPKSLPIGTTITLLKQRGPWTPSNPEEVGSFYVTAAASGRIAASNTIDEIVAAGVSVDKIVVYPSDKGLGNEGAPDVGAAKLSDRVAVWGGDNLDAELAEAREE